MRSKNKKEFVEVLTDATILGVLADNWVAGFIVGIAWAIFYFSWTSNISEKEIEQ